MDLIGLLLRMPMNFIRRNPGNRSDEFFLTINQMIILSPPGIFFGNPRIMCLRIDTGVLSSRMPGSLYDALPLLILWTDVFVIISIGKSSIAPVTIIRGYSPTAKCWKKFQPGVMGMSYFPGPGIKTNGFTGMSLANGCIRCTRWNF